MAIRQQIDVRGYEAATQRAGHPSESPVELYLQWITVQAQIGGLGGATDKQEAREGVAWAWGARPAHLLYMLPSAYAS